MRLRIAIAASTVLTALIGFAGVAPAYAGPKDDLIEVVRAMLLARGRAAHPELRAAVPDPQVNLAKRTTRRWGFGTAVLPAPATLGAYPEGWLFIAHRDKDGWTAALEGQPTFADLAARSPILTDDERRVFGARPDRTEAGSTGFDRRTGLRLPFAVGQTWRLTGGPHPMRDTIRSAIDLAGGDGRVLAARGGLAYTMCSSGTGWLRVIHDRGFATDYYHLSGNIRASGTTVAEGTFLGDIGNDVSCGGSSTGAHVHFALRYKNKYIALDRFNVGKWVIRQSPGDYAGYALHGSTRVNVGANLYNYGKLGFRQGVVDTNGGRNLNRRKGPGTNYPIVGQTPDGATVDIACSARGTTHTGRDGHRTNQWNKLTDGTWVSDAFLWTGRSDPLNGWCP